MAGNWGIISNWMTQYGDQITRTITGMIGDSDAAQDIAQETFIRAYNSLDNFTHKSAPYTYLYRIAYNLVIDYKRVQSRKKIQEIREQRYDGTYLLDSLETIDSDFIPETKVLHNEKIAAVRKAVQFLPAKFLHPTALYYLADLGVAEIAEILNISSGTIKSRLYRARKRLEILLKDVQDHHDGVSVRVRR
ncbi:MAG: sigma-70 family RNA polymerase sigma factor [Bacteroidetes bacterium]|nr:sigma-70 family RNA polymerase sigma factor [Bacteroidota bacterium]